MDCLGNYWLLASAPFNRLDIPIAFAVIVVGIMLRKLVCTSCYYYGKWCPIGWGKLSALMFKKAESYGDNGYPWTWLGYTYDWGNPKSEIGLSEFIVMAGSTIKIHSVTGTLDYFKN